VLLPGAGGALVEGEEEILLVLEVIGKDAVRDAGFPADLGERRLRPAPLRHEVLSRFEDLIAADGADVNASHSR
jgi:hypothetical protein